jgi:hypothetical protein
VDLKVKIAITDEQSEGHRDVDRLARPGQRRDQPRRIPRLRRRRTRPAWDSNDYEFTSGTLSHDGKDVEFRIDINKTTGQYSVRLPAQLLEIKLRAAALFAGYEREGSAPAASGSQGRWHHKPAACTDMEALDPAVIEQLARPTCISRPVTATPAWAPGAARDHRRHPRGTGRAGRFHEKPVGPHPMWSYQLAFPRTALRTWWAGSR